MDTQVYLFQSRVPPWQAAPKFTVLCYTECLELRRTRDVLFSYLHSYDGDDLNLDAVELVEAPPAA